MAYNLEALRMLKIAIRLHGFTDLGGYPLYALMGDGETMSIAACKDNFREIAYAHIYDPRSDWFVQAVDINWEDEDMVCAHTNEPIECAYPADKD